MDKRTHGRLQDMRDYARKAISVLGERTHDEFEREEIINLAVTRCIEIVGEAASHIDVSIRSELPEIEWKQIIGTRVVLAHAYMRITLETLYGIVKNDLPKLIEQLDKILENEHDYDT